MSHYFVILKKYLSDKKISKSQRRIKMTKKINIKKDFVNFFKKDLKPEKSNLNFAYLALTSKIENQIRDYFASKMHTKHLSNKIIPAKEWLRRDLVFIDLEKKGVPKIFIEFKSWYSFDFIKNLERKVIKEMFTDFDKIKRTIKEKCLDNTDCEIYTLTLSTHPHSAINNPEQYENIIKYIYGINDCYTGNPRKKWTKQGFKSEKDLEKTVRDKFESLLKHKDKITYGRTYLGKAFNTDVSLMFWLYGPFKYSDKIS
jgi:hypothetical protein